MSLTLPERFMDELAEAMEIIEDLREALPRFFAQQPRLAELVPDVAQMLDDPKTRASATVLLAFVRLADREGL